MEIRFDESEVVVVDLGSGFIKAGYSGNDVPHVVIPTVVSEKMTDTAADESGPGNEGKSNKVVSRHVGNEAFMTRDDHELFFPIQRGIIHWDHMTTLLEHVFDHELGINPRSCTVLMTDSLCSSKKDKQDLAALMFDHFRFKAFAL